MKRWFAMILAAAIALSLAACTTEQPPETTPPTTTAATTGATIESTTASTTEPTVSCFTIGNLKFTLEPSMSVRKTRSGTYVVTVVPNKAKAEFIANDISHIKESHIDTAIADRFDAYEGQRGDNVIGESEFSISFSGFDATGKTYSKHDGENIKSTHMDFIFTDTWYAYIVLYTITDTNTDAARDYGEIFGAMLSSVECIGPARREPAVTDPEETKKPQSSQQAENPKQTEPPTPSNPKETEPPATTQPSEDPSTGERNALSSAKSYLRISAFSYLGLIDQLEHEGYTTSEATYAADNCGADWNEQALNSGNSYLNVSAFSYKGLIKQLEYEKFTNAQATYAADNCGADWNEQALKSSKSYLGISAFSYKGLIKQLEYEKFTSAQATYAADNCGADWYEQAVECAKSYLDIMSMSRSQLISQLEYEGFTHDQAVYGAEQNGL